MAAGTELNPTSYINHHLTFFAKSFGDGGFWTLHVDTLVMSLLAGVAGIGFIWWGVGGATAGVPNKRQAFVELAFDFVRGPAKSIFQHGDLNKFVPPTPLT